MNTPKFVDQNIFDFNMLGQGSAYIDTVGNTWNWSAPGWTQDKMFGFHEAPEQKVRP
jgi:hypothetical protein